MGSSPFGRARVAVAVWATVLLTLIVGAVGQRTTAEPGMSPSSPAKETPGKLLGAARASTSPNDPEPSTGFPENEAPTARPSGPRPSKSAPELSGVGGTETSSPSSSVVPSAQPVDERVGLEPYKGVGITPFPAACPDLGMLGASWYYTWWHNARCDGYNAQFVPMVWGDWCADGSDCSALPSALAESGATTLLGFNEPDNPEQSNLSVERALQLWAVLDATPLRLGSPAVSADPPSRARAWMDEFMEGAEARGLRVDFVAAHWYGDCSSPADLVHFLNGLARYGRPVWLTEFSCWHQSEQVNQGFVETAINAVSELPWVERIAWFTNRPYAGGWEASALVSNQGQLTAVGSTFLHMPPCRDHRRLNGADHYQLTACD